jgi:hypothetical protein
MIPSLSGGLRPPAIILQPYELREPLAEKASASEQSMLLPV